MTIGSRELIIVASAPSLFDYPSYAIQCPVNNCCTRMHIIVHLGKRESDGNIEINALPLLFGHVSEPNIRPSQFYATHHKMHAVNLQRQAGLVS